jgi:hypothetical protein
MIDLPDSWAILHGPGVPLPITTLLNEVSRDDYYTIRNWLDSWLRYCEQIAERQMTER